MSFSWWDEVTDAADAADDPAEMRRQCRDALDLYDKLGPRRARALVALIYAAIVNGIRSEMPDGPVLPTRVPDGRKIH